MKPKVVARIRDGTYEDQYGAQHECYEVLEIQRIEHEKTTTRESGYEGVQDKTVWMKDGFNRDYSKVKSGISYYHGPRWDGPDLSDDEEWVELDKLRSTSNRRSKPMLTPSGQKLPKFALNDGYMFFEDTQLKMTLRV